MNRVQSFCNLVYTRAFYVVAAVGTISGIYAYLSSGAVELFFL